MLLCRGFPDCVWVTGDRISLFFISSFRILWFIQLIRWFKYSDCLYYINLLLLQWYFSAFCSELQQCSESSLSTTTRLCGNKSFYVVQGDHHKRLAVKLNLCLTNGSVVSNSWSWLVMEFTDAVKVNDPHEQPLCLPLAACLSLVLQYLWPHYKEQKSTSACLWQVSSLSLHLNVYL